MGPFRIGRQSKSLAINISVCHKMLKQLLYQLLASAERTVYNKYQIPVDEFRADSFAVLNLTVNITNKLKTTLQKNDF
jgi:hypothetical protein